MKVKKMRMYWKDRPSDINYMKFGLLEPTENVEDMEERPDDNTIFYYIEGAKDLADLQNPNNKGEFVICKMDDYHATGIAEGFIESDSYEEEIEAWQHLHDTGIAYTLQGWFGRTATRMIEEGIIAK